MISILISAGPEDEAAFDHRSQAEELFPELFLRYKVEPSQPKPKSGKSEAPNDFPKTLYRAPSRKALANWRKLKKNSWEYNFMQRWIPDASKRSDLLLEYILRTRRVPRFRSKNWIESLIGQSIQTGTLRTDRTYRLGNFWADYGSQLDFPDIVFSIEPHVRSKFKIPKNLDRQKLFEWMSENKWNPTDEEFWSQARYVDFTWTLSQWIAAHGTWPSVQSENRLEKQLARDINAKFGNRKQALSRLSKEAQRALQNKCDRLLGKLPSPRDLLNMQK